MNRMLQMLVIAAICMVSAIMAQAVTPVAKTVTLTNGVGSYEFERDYYAFQIQAVDYYGLPAVTNTMTVSRIRNGRTNSFDTVTITTGRGVSYPTNKVWFFKGDVALFVTAATNAASVEFVKELNQ